MAIPRELMEMIMGSGGPEYDALMKEVSEITCDRIKVLAAGNDLAELYIHELFNSVFGRLKKSILPMSNPITPRVLHMIADIVELKQQKTAELNAKRKMEAVTIPFGTKKDMH